MNATFGSQRAWFGIGVSDRERKYKIFMKMLAILLFIAGTAAAQLKVELQDARNDEGLIRVALWDGAKGFPREVTMAKQRRQAKPVRGRVVVEFADLAPGRYAITAIHDENSNGKLDTNLMGIPKERYGFSNGARGKFGPPPFSAAEFSYEGGAKAIGLVLK